MSTAALAWRQFRFERRMFWRNPSAAFFNFTLPFLFLILVASVFNSDHKELNILVPGIAGLAVLGTTFTALAYSFVFAREQGILKRIRGTPMPPLAYFGGVIGSAVANAIVQVALVIVIGRVFYSTKSMPIVLKAIAVALPLKHVIDGIHGAIVTGAGLGDHLTALAVVGGWTVAGLVLAVRFFRWD